MPSTQRHGTTESPADATRNAVSCGDLVANAPGHTEDVLPGVGEDAPLHVQQHRVARREAAQRPPEVAVLSLHVVRVRAAARAVEVLMPRPAEALDDVVALGFEKTTDTSREQEHAQRLPERGSRDQVDRDLEQWIKLAGAILTSKADTASLVTAPKARRSRFKRLELLRLSDSNVLLLVMLSDGTIRRRIISLAARSIPATLQALAEEFDTLLLDLTSEQVRTSFSRLKGAHATVGEQVAELMDDVDRHHDLELDWFKVC